MSPSNTANAKALFTLDLLKDHTKYLNAAGKKLPSVTTILKILDKPALLHWAWEQGREGNDYRKVSEAAGNVGSISHGMCEAHLRGMELHTGNLAPDAVAAAETAFLKFLDWWDANGFTMVHCELQMVDELWQVGGTLDIVALHPNGDLWLIDIKTSKGIYDEMIMQTSAYAEMFERKFEQKIVQNVILRIGKADPGDFEAFLIPDDLRRAGLEAFEGLVPVHRQIGDFRKLFKARRS